MEKKNTILLTVIAVATLLVAVVGATFAYFTASTSTGDGRGDVTTGTATSIGSVAMNLQTIANSNNMSYPGGMLLNGASVTATVTGAGTFDASYTINANVDANALTSKNTTLNVTLYKTTSQISDAAVSGCALQNGTAGEDVTYYYTGCAVPTGITTGQKVDSKTITITADGPKTATLTFDDSTTFSGITSASPTTAYYYLVVEYVNNDAADQNADMGKTVTATISNITNAASTARQA